MHVRQVVINSFLFLFIPCGLYKQTFVTEMQSFFDEIENIANEDIVNDDFTNIETKLNKKCAQIIEKKKNSTTLPIQSKIILFLEEIDFINHTLNVYEEEKEREKERELRRRVEREEDHEDEDKEKINKKKRRGKNESNEQLGKEVSKDLDDILKDVIYLELGLKESENTNNTKKILLEISEILDKIESKDFVLTTKKSLDIRIDDFRKNEISETYFSKKINEIYQDTLLNSEQEDGAKRANESISEETKNNFVDEIPHSNLIVSSSVNDDTNEGSKGSGPYPTYGYNGAGEGRAISNKNTGKKANTRKNKNQQKIESSNFFHKKKVHKWNSHKWIVQTEVSREVAESSGRNEAKE
ncbi:conserved Plasmodium protein, unknown function [Plasmodium malariae]|uniref:Uncharacterized protein n=2 Tax=Plasmodium malariae TaxID=5858 RepID=A0A1D3TCY2_PLAMA|nr:conserved Plasmodium protein, unknown function [Plasmodium malariae]SCP02701.1 conserved Plasmodium protein, unknown function [Plasmodium malariae]